MSTQQELEAIEHALKRALVEPTYMLATSPRAAASLRFSAYRKRQILARQQPEIARVVLTLEGHILWFTYKPSRLEQLT